MNELTKYQEIVLADVQNPNYSRHRRMVWGVFGFFGLFFAALYALFFHRGIVVYWGFVGRMYRESLVSPNPTFRNFVYIYNHLLLFTGFAGVVVLFAALSWLAYDMQARNEVIRHLLQQDSKANNAAASKEESS
ncbi:MAG TPA: hypothetical protein VI895_06725 [Bdellovibrionota bacterium]|nr:hypothetical protein [Bdellovibrionota bacterium]